MFNFAHGVGVEEIIVIGDTNCQFGENVGYGFSDVSTVKNKMLKTFADFHRLSIIDGDDNCFAPNYNFHVDGVCTYHIETILYRQWFGDVKYCLM